MPDKRTHRGPHPQDEKLFAVEALPLLRQATADLSLLLTKGYADKSALKLVGDRFGLTKRQRLAVMRSACSDAQLQSRIRRMLPEDALEGADLLIDGYNLLITIEAAMSNAVILKARDGCFRDLAGIHGTYRRVNETAPAVELIGKFLQEKSVAAATWLLDSPVSNSGRLKTLMGQIARQNNWNWHIQLLTSPDAELVRSEMLVVSTDAPVLDRCGKWVNLAGVIITEKLPHARVIDLAP